MYGSFRLAIASPVCGTASIPATKLGVGDSSGPSPAKAAPSIDGLAEGGASVVEYFSSCVIMGIVG